MSFRVPVSAMTALARKFSAARGKAEKRAVIGKNPEFHTAKRGQREPRTRINAAAWGPKPRNTPRSPVSASWSLL